MALEGVRMEAVEKPEVSEGTTDKTMVSADLNNPPSSQCFGLTLVHILMSDIYNSEIM
jgi:hypothetical protein